MIKKRGKHLPANLLLRKRDKKRFVLPFNPKVRKIPGWTTGT
jgi:hypothetical protein